MDDASTYCDLVMQANTKRAVMHLIVNQCTIYHSYHITIKLPTYSNFKLVTYTRIIDFVRVSQT